MLPRPLTPVYQRVGQAASELFLDTEVRWSIPWIAAEARASGLPWSAVDELFFKRVVPALVANLYDVAGEWAGFDRGWLAEALEKGGRVHLPLPPWVRTHWQVVRTFFDWPDLPEHWPIFQSLAHLVLEKDWSLTSHVCRLLTVPWDLLLELYAEVFRPRFEPLRVSGDATPAETAEHWAWLQRFHAWLGGQPAEALQICRELEYVYRIPRLGHCPRGPMVVEALRPHAARVPGCLAGPLGQLAPPCADWEANQAYLLAQLGLKQARTTE